MEKLLPKAEEVEECTACGRIVSMSRLLETPLGVYICDDFQECIAFYSGWTEPTQND